MLSIEKKIKDALKLYLLITFENFIIVPASYKHSIAFIYRPVPFFIPSRLNSPYDRVKVEYKL